MLLLLQATSQELNGSHLSRLSYAWTGMYERNLIARQSWRISFA